MADNMAETLDNLIEPSNNKEQIVTESQIDVSVKTFLNAKLSEYVDLSKLSWKIDERKKKFIYNIIENNASLFNEFEALIKQIISDDKIDMRDAPAIILLLKLVYEFIYNEKNKEIGSEDITQLASFLLKESFNLLLTEDIIQVNSDKKDSLTSSFNSLIDVCAELINLNSTLKPKKCKNWVKSLF